jgi:hypothetical protein
MRVETHRASTTRTLRYPDIVVSCLKPFHFASPSGMPLIACQRLQQAGAASAPCPASPVRPVRPVRPARPSSHAHGDVHAHATSLEFAPHSDPLCPVVPCRALLLANWELLPKPSRAFGRIRIRIVHAAQPSTPFSGRLTQTMQPRFRTPNARLHPHDTHLHPCLDRTERGPDAPQPHDAIPDA